MRKIVFAGAVFLLLSCSNPERDALLKTCITSTTSVDIYEEDKHISKTSTGLKFMAEVCPTKVDLYREGYRTDLLLSKEDFVIWRLSMMTGKSFRSIYLKSISER